MSLLRTIGRYVALESLGFYTAARRYFYFTFRRHYVLAMVARRKGVCGGHGCCNLHLLHKIFFRRCTDPADRRRCLKWKNLPEGCRLYPFDEKDKCPRSRAFCHFHWDEEKKAQGSRYSFTRSDAKNSGRDFSP